MVLTGRKGTKMTDLEALECIVVDLTPKAQEHNKEEIEQVRKSLEELEMRAPKTFKEVYKFYLWKRKQK